VSTRLDLKPGLIAKLKAQLTVAVIAASIAETSAIVLSLVVDLNAGAVPRLLSFCMVRQPCCSVTDGCFLTHVEHSTQRFDNAMSLLKDARRA